MKSRMGLVIAVQPAEEIDRPGGSHLYRRRRKTGLLQEVLRLLDEVHRFDLHRGAQLKQGCDGGLSLASFQQSDVGPINAGLMSQLLLAEELGCAVGSEHAPKAARNVFRWPHLLHADNLAAAMTIVDGL